MQGKLVDIRFGRNGERYITFETTENYEEEYDRLQSKQVEVIIKEHKEKRSLNANAYAWVLIGKLAEKLNVPKTDIYKSAIREIGGVSDVICVQNKAVDSFIKGWESNGIGYQCEKMDSKLQGCTNVMIYYGSSSYDSAQMSRLIDIIVNECKEQGIETLDEMKLRIMLEDWE